MKHRVWLWTLMTAAMVQLTGCAGVKPSEQHSPEEADVNSGNNQTQQQASQPINPSPQSSSIRPLPSHEAKAASSPSAGGVAFSTKYAHFQPVAFSEISGWGRDDLMSSLDAFRQSCTALSKKPAWTELCREANQLSRQPSVSNEAIREFFEKSFNAYAVLNADRSQEGMFTGYYEPLLQGSLSATSRFRYPLYGTPSDLLFIEAKTVAKGPRQWLRVENKKLLSVPVGTSGAQEYDIDLQDSVPNIRDKRFRVRIAGKRIVAYWSRQQIEKQSLHAPVLAWVDDPYKLYSLHIQGSGKIRLPDGKIVRVAYAEQNGYPFLPQANGKKAALLATAIKTRSFKSVSEAVDESPDAPGSELSEPAHPSAFIPTRSLSSSNKEVSDLIAQLKGLKGSPSSNRPHPGGNKKSAESSQAVVSAAKKFPPVAVSVFSKPEFDGSTNLSDPSYVFFRRIPDNNQGPIGALGVPLTAGRSLAVDPRTTPLGYPVFVAATAGAKRTPLEKLVFAQDTGGAIRGSVRGDYFWGFGQEAGAKASTMKDNGRMWLLLPKKQEVKAVLARTRALSGTPVPLSECVIPDEDNCVEE